jgi:hypothetical protein
MERTTVKDRANPIEEHYDLVVVGGGLAGLCAAVSAARLGEKVVLVQDRPVLGGNSSSEIRVVTQGAGGLRYFRDVAETGVMGEVWAESWYQMPQQARRKSEGVLLPQWDFILEEWVYREPNATLYLNARAIEPIMGEDGRIIGVKALQHSTERSYILYGKYFVDASGDGTIAFRAGAEYHYGREARSEFNERMAPESADEKVLPATIRFTTRDHGRPMPFHPPSWARKFPTDADLPYRNHERFREGYFWTARGGEMDMVDDIEQIRTEDLAAVLGLWDHIKNYGNHGAENFALEWVGIVPGKRESRRFVGDHMLSQSEIESAELFPDRVAYGGRCLDLHPAEGINSPEPPCRNPMLSDLFSIPLRSLYSRNVPNLFVAGRNASQTHVALGSSRVMATCAIMGQAAGTAAHFCHRYGIMPRQLVQDHITEVQQQLVADDCYIIDLPSQDTNDLARRAKVTASSNAPLPVVHRDKMESLKIKRGQLFPISSSRLDVVRLNLASALQHDQDVTVTLHTAGAVRDFYKGRQVTQATATTPANSDSWVDFRFDRQVQPGLYWLEVEAIPGLSWAWSREEPLGTQAVSWSEGEITSLDELMMPGLIPQNLPDYDPTPRWRLDRGSYAIQLEPVSYPYGPEQVISGVTRTERATNIWISDPKQPLPQSLELDFGAPVDLARLQVTFHLNTDVPDPNAGPQPGGSPEMPDCVRDYRVEYEVGGRWDELLAEKGNHHRQRRHSFPVVKTGKIRLVVEATAGSPSAQVFEVRAYGPR